MIKVMDNCSRCGTPVSERLKEIRKETAQLTVDKYFRKMILDIESIEAHGLCEGCLDNGDYYYDDKLGIPYIEYLEVLTKDERLTSFTYDLTYVMEDYVDNMARIDLKPNVFWANQVNLLDKIITELMTGNEIYDLKKIKAELVNTIYREMDPEKVFIQFSSNYLNKYTPDMITYLESIEYLDRDLKADDYKDEVAATSSITSFGGPVGSPIQWRDNNISSFINSLYRNDLRIATIRNTNLLLNEISNLTDKEEGISVELRDTINKYKEEILYEVQEIIKDEGEVKYMTSMLTLLPDKLRELV